MIPRPRSQHHTRFTTLRVNQGFFGSTSHPAKNSRGSRSAGNWNRVPSGNTPICGGGTGIGTAGALLGAWAVVLLGAGAAGVLLVALLAVLLGAGAAGAPLGAAAVVLLVAGAAGAPLGV